MIQQAMDTLQWAIDRVYGLIPRRLERNAVKPLLVGHRGVFDHPQVVENTLPAFDMAVVRGGGIEFDLHLTKDGVVVVHHDPTLLRIHATPETIAELTMTQLRQLAPEVPTVDEVFERYGRRCPHYFLEPKVTSAADRQRLATAIGESLRRAGLERHVTLLSPDPRMLDTARDCLPGLNKAIIFFADPRSAMQYVRKHQDTGLAGWYLTFSGTMRRFLEQTGRHAGVGQVDYENTYYQCCNRGFRYQFTNRIDRLAAPLESLSLPDVASPAEGPPLPILW